MITIDPHYNGPPGMGHGGVSAGRFAAEVEPDAAVVKLRRPIPLDRTLATRRDGAAVSILDGDAVIATVRDLDGPLVVASSPDVTDLDLERAERHWLDPVAGRHMAPGCFACGHERGVGGLGLRPGPIAETGWFGCRWRPEGDGPLAPWLVWAALDCPTGFPAFATTGHGEAVVTAELAVQLLERVRAGETLRLFSRLVESDGRRHRTEAVMTGADGRRLAVATAVWCTVSIAAFQPAA